MFFKNLHVQCMIDDELIVSKNSDGKSIENLINIIIKKIMARIFLAKI